MEIFSRDRNGPSARTLAVYRMPGRENELTERVARAANWLAAETPQSTEARVMGLGIEMGWRKATGAATADEGTDRPPGRPDGGWAQTPWLASDAYATGQVLYMLHETDAAAKKQRGCPSWHRVSFTLRRKKMDRGS